MGPCTRFIPGFTSTLAIPFPGVVNAGSRRAVPPAGGVHCNEQFFLFYDVDGKPCCLPPGHVMGELQRNPIRYSVRALSDCLCCQRRTHARGRYRVPIPTNTPKGPAV